MKKRNRIGKNARARKAALKAFFSKYVCQVCDGTLLACETTQGLKPPFITCKAKADCSGAMIFAGQVSDGVPTYEFFQPKAHSWRNFDAGTREYLEAGGLLLRALPPLIKGLDVAAVGKDQTAAQVLELCQNCGGAGVWRAAGVYNITCAPCGGTGKLPLAVSRLELLTLFPKPTAAERGRVTTDDVRRIAGNSFHFHKCENCPKIWTCSKKACETDNSSSCAAPELFCEVTKNRRRFDEFDK